MMLFISISPLQLAFLDVEPDALVQIEARLVPPVQPWVRSVRGVVGELAEALEGARFGVDGPVDAGFAEGVDHGLLVRVRVGVGGGGGGGGGREEDGCGGESCEEVGEGGGEHWGLHFGGGLVGVSMLLGSLVFCRI